MKKLAFVILVTVCLQGIFSFEENTGNDYDVTPPPMLEGGDISESRSKEAEVDPDWISWAGSFDGDIMLTEEQRRQLNNTGSEDAPPTPSEEANMSEPRSAEAEEDPDWISWAGAFEGDIMLTEEQLRQLNNTSSERNAVRRRSQLWPKGVIPYVISMSSFSRAERLVVYRAFGEYRKRTCLRFVKRSNQKAYINIVRKNGCWSFIGRTGSRQTVSLGKGCVHKSIVIHELMHATGFYHEQSRYDRDRYVKINWENIRPGNKGNFRKEPRSKIQLLGEPYDMNSVMHYYSKAFSKNGKKTIERRDGKNIEFRQSVGLSQIDVRKLNKLYRCSSTQGKCTDGNKYCSAWAKNKYCTRGEYVKYMKKSCKKSCNRC